MMLAHSWEFELPFYTEKLLASKWNWMFVTMLQCNMRRVKKTKQHSRVCWLPFMRNLPQACRFVHRESNLSFQCTPLATSKQLPSPYWIWPRGNTGGSPSAS